MALRLDNPRLLSCVFVDNLNCCYLSRNEIYPFEIYPLYVITATQIDISKKKLFPLLIKVYIIQHVILLSLLQTLSKMT